MTEQTGRVVVGVDGSSESHDALAWAARYAQATGTAVAAVMTWRFPPTYGYVPDIDWGSFETESKAVLDEAVAGVLQQVPGVDIAQYVVEGHPSQVLVDASKTAALLVVGSRGRGGFAGAVLGSVSSYCVHHAHCPVVVVRDHRH